MGPGHPGTEWKTSQKLNMGHQVQRQGAYLTTVTTTLCNSSSLVATVRLVMSVVKSLIGYGAGSKPSQPM